MMAWLTGICAVTTVLRLTFVPYDMDLHRPMGPEEFRMDEGGAMWWNNQDGEGWRKVKWNHLKWIEIREVEWRDDKAYNPENVQKD
jgi:hypothetical protein